MEEVIRFLLQYGYVFLLGWVVADQIGLPLPAAPALLAAGALAGKGSFEFNAALGVSVCGCLLADIFWFYLGRRGGGRVLNFICRISLEPDSCVRRANNVIGKYGPKSLLVAKFIPGMNAVAAPLAGSSAVSLPKFLLFDVLGSLLWCGSFLSVGYLFREQVKDIALFLGQFKWPVLLALLVLLPSAYIVFKHRQRQRFIRENWIERITPEELMQQIQAGELSTIVDLRHPLDFLPDPRTLPNAIRILPDELDQKSQELPRDREVVLYCT
jgi:membrane protein DedA with SNARE-associated domain